MDPLIAEVDMAARAVEFVKYALIVAAAFIVGNVLTLVLCRIIAKYTTKQKFPDPIERAFRMIGGLILAIVVGYLLFKGFGFGGTGTGDGKESGGQTPGTENLGKEKQPPTKVDPKPKEDPATLASGLKVTILRGRDFPKSYLFEGETEGVDFVTAKEKLRQRLEASDGRLKFVDVMIYKNSTAEKSALIEDLETFAHDLGLRTSRKKLDQSLPD